MSEHTLKTSPLYFQALVDGVKYFEIRRNDRGFMVGDQLLLQEYDLTDTRYTGRSLSRTIIYITDFHQQEGWVVLGLDVTTALAKGTP